MSAGGTSTKAYSEDDLSQSQQELSTMMEKQEDSSFLDCPSEANLKQDAASNATVATLKTRSIPDSGSPAFRSQSSSQAATFVRQKNGWTQKKQYRLKNSLLAGVGLLELGNAGDFAANVWNQIPIPRFAMALSTPSLILLLSQWSNVLPLSKLIVLSSGSRRHPSPRNIHLRNPRCLPEPRKHSKPP